MRLGFVTKVLHDLNKRKKRDFFLFFHSSLPIAYDLLCFLIYFVLESICAKVAYVVNNF